LSASAHVLPVHGVFTATTTLRIGGAMATQGGLVSYYLDATLLGTVAMTGGSSSLGGTQLDSPGVHVLTAEAQMPLCAGTVAAEPETVFVVPAGGPATSMGLTVTPSQVPFGASV